jgi:hypothetical protein
MKLARPFVLLSAFSMFAGSASATTMYWLSATTGKPYYLDEMSCFSRTDMGKVTNNGSCGSTARLWETDIVRVPGDQATPTRSYSAWGKSFLTGGTVCYIGMMHPDGHMIRWSAGAAMPTASGGTTFIASMVTDGLPVFECSIGPQGWVASFSVAEY